MFLKIRVKVILTQFVKLLLLLSRSLKIIYLIINELDECEKRQLILESLNEIISAMTEENIKLFISNYPEADINTTFSDYQIFQMKDHIQSNIKLYINQSLRYNPKFDNNLRKTIRRKMLKNSNQIYKPLFLNKIEWLIYKFLWIKYLLKDIESLLNAQSWWNVFKNLPSALSEVYDDILWNIRDRWNLLYVIRSQ